MFVLDNGNDQYRGKPLKCDIMRNKLDVFHTGFLGGTTLQNTPRTSFSKLWIVNVLSAEYIFWWLVFFLFLLKGNYGFCMDNITITYSKQTISEQAMQAAIFPKPAEKIISKTFVHLNFVQLNLDTLLSFALTALK